MPLRALDNSGWGFESNCFVCEPANDQGLRIPFFHDEEGERVTAEFTLGPEFSGAPSYVHGGLVLAVLDEAMAWAAIALAGRMAVTRTTTSTFEHPVKVGRTYRVDASVDGGNERELATSARVVDEKGRLCTTADARFVVLSEVQARSAIGELSDDDARYLRSDPS